MAAYELPPIKKEDKDNEPEVSASGIEEYRRRISIPVNDEILSSLTTGDDVRVVLRGQVTATRSSTSTEEHGNEQSIELTIASVTTDGDGGTEDDGLDYGFDENIREGDML